MSELHVVSTADASTERLKKYFFWCFRSFIIFISISVLRCHAMPMPQSALDIIVSWMLVVQVGGAAIGMLIFGTWWKQTEKHLE